MEGTTGYRQCVRTVADNTLCSVDLSIIMDSIELLVEEMRELNQYESRTGRLSRKIKENPFLGIGMLGLVGVCTVGAMRFKTRPLNMSPSMYLMQLRVLAQGSVVGSLLGGTAYTMFNNCKKPALHLLRRQ